MCCLVLLASFISLACGSGLWGTAWVCIPCGSRLHVNSYTCRWYWGRGARRVDADSLLRYALFLVAVCSALCHCPAVQRSLHAAAA